MEASPAPAGVASSSAELRDTRTVAPSNHPVCSRRRVNAFVTSPPYANALPYIDTDRLSLLVLGILSAPQRNKLQKRIIGNREIHEGERRAVENDLLGPSGLRTLPSDVGRQIRRVLVQNGKHPVGF